MIWIALIIAVYCFSVAYIKSNQLPFMGSIMAIYHINNVTPDNKRLYKACIFLMYCPLMNTFMAYVTYKTKNFKKQ